MTCAVAKRMNVNGKNVTRLTERRRVGLQDGSEDNEEIGPPKPHSLVACAMVHTDDGIDDGLSAYKYAKLLSVSKLKWPTIFIGVITVIFFVVRAW